MASCRTVLTACIHQFCLRLCIRSGGEIGCLLCEGLHRLGETEVPVYDGSWTEWATEPDLPMEGEGDESSS